MSFARLTICFLFTFIVILNLTSFSFSDPRTSVAGFFCSQNRAPNTTVFPLANYTKNMNAISKQVTKSHWGSSSIQTNLGLPIYALAYCYGDLPQMDCLNCYDTSCARLPLCVPSLGARIFLDGCFIRYEVYNFFNESVDPMMDAVNCTSEMVGGGGEEDAAALRVRVRELVNNVSEVALGNKGYAVMELAGVFGLAQCWKTLAGDGCRNCLAKAAGSVQECFPGREGRALNAGCYLRYSTQKFYNDVNNSSTRSFGANGTEKTVAIATSVAVFCMIAAFTAYAIYRRTKKKKQERRNLGRISSWYNKSNLNFKYETLEKATNYFDSKMQLGQGGAGSVYKGTLSDGKVIAVKRLFFHTRQWVDEFFNEVNLINGVEHKNLVKLLGCSIEGPESLLVYEFVPNKSLNHYLFDDKIKVLTWKQRFQIIVGTAEGIAYLHGGSQKRIIHRDIKGSNVLLDEHFSPKIADFGLAKHFQDDKTHMSTGIAGTPGYMAPEYLIKGQLTEKADVYSFGVLVLEIVGGKKNTGVLDESGSLLQSVWKLYKMNKVCESVDSCLRGEFPAEEAHNVVKIGLLCTQAWAPFRPSMDEVVQMLTDPDQAIPQPNQPPFVNASSSVAYSTPSYSSTSSSLPNEFFKLKLGTSSSTSTELFGSYRVHEEGKQEVEKSSDNYPIKSLSV